MERELGEKQRFLRFDEFGRVFEDINCSWDLTGDPVLRPLQDPVHAYAAGPAVRDQAQILPHTHHTHSDTRPVPAGEAHPTHGWPRPRPR